MTEEQSIASIINLNTDLRGTVYPLVKSLDHIHSIDFIIYPPVDGSNDAVQKSRNFLVKVKATTKTSLESKVDDIIKLTSNYTDGFDPTTTSYDDNYIVTDYENTGYVYYTDKADWTFSASSIANNATTFIIRNDQDTTPPISNESFGIIVFNLPIPKGATVNSASVYMKTGNTQGLKTIDYEIKGILIGKVFSTVTPFPPIDYLVPTTTENVTGSQEFEDFTVYNWNIKSIIEEIIGDDGYMGIDLGIVIQITSSAEHNYLVFAGQNEAGDAVEANLPYLDIDFDYPTFPFWISATVRSEPMVSPTGLWYQDVEIEGRWVL